jgi:hypothetical protein
LIFAVILALLISGFLYWLVMQGAVSLIPAVRSFP